MKRRLSCVLMQNKMEKNYLKSVCLSGRLLQYVIGYGKEAHITISHSKSIREIPLSFNRLSVLTLLVNGYLIYHMNDILWLSLILVE